jgi:hypothetical protein
MHKAFQVHMLNDQGKQKANALAAAFDEVLSKVAELTKTAGAEAQNGRELALVTTHMELASFYAKKAMAQLLRTKSASSAEAATPPPLQRGRRAVQPEPKSLRGDRHEATCGSDSNPL